MERQRPKYAWVDLSEEQIEEGKQKMKSLDFVNPDMDILIKSLLENTYWVRWRKKQACINAHASPDKVWN